jgi:hypothetical protein
MDTPRSPSRSVKSKRHDLTLPEMAMEEIRQVVDV